MCDLIDPKLMFITIFCHTSIRSHHPSIAEKDIESLGLGEKLFDSAFDGSQRSLVAFEEDDLEGRVGGFGERNNFGGAY